MKARPILFNTDMVKAILAGQKTQTRREVKGVGDDNWLKGASNHVVHALDKCPFGQPGDLLYVRETFAIRDDNSVNDGGAVYLASEPCGSDRWKPSIHMPRWASRLTLEITDVRVERLQEISDEDSSAEGFAGGHGAIPGYGYSATSVEHFVHVWDSIYGNWDTNPWVWVVEFKVHHCNVDALLRDRGE